MHTAALAADDPLTKQRDGRVDGLTRPSLQHHVATPVSTARSFCEEGGLQAVLQLLRITQEALTNVLKHAQATPVRVALRHAGAGLELEVEDDGRASTLPVRSGGRGLANMHTRARQLGGVLAVEHGRRGTRVLLRVPAAAERIGAAHAIA